MTYGFVGTKEFDAGAVGAFLTALPRGSRVVAGEGECEKWVREQARELGFEVTVPELRPDLFDWVEEYDAFKGPGTTKGVKKHGPEQYLGKKRRTVVRSKDMQVYDICNAALDGGTVVIIGKGGRQSRAREWFETLTETPLYGKPRDKAIVTVPVTVVEL